MIGVETIRAGIGLEVQMLQMTMGTLIPEIPQLLRGYDARRAPKRSTTHFLSLEIGQLIAEPIRVF